MNTFARPFNTGDETVIAVMGATGCGKSTFINLVSGSHLTVSDSLRSCTSMVQSAASFQLAGRSIRLVDTPGFDDTVMSDTDVLKMIAAYLAATYEGGLKLSGIIYMQRITDRRVGGMSRRNFSMLRKLCGDDTLKNVAIVTNMWDVESEEKGVIRERELMTDDLFFKPVLEKGAQMLRHNNTLASAQAIVSHFIRKTPLSLLIQRELVDYHKDITETEAGVVLQGEIEAFLEKHRQELAAIRQDMERVIAEKDAQARKELEQVKEELQNKLKKAEDDRVRLSEEYRREKIKADEELARLREEYRSQNEARINMQNRINELEKQGRRPSPSPKKKRGRLAKLFGTKW